MARRTDYDSDERGGRVLAAQKQRSGGRAGGAGADGPMVVAPPVGAVLALFPVVAGGAAVGDAGVAGELIKHFQLDPALCRMDTGRLSIFASIGATRIISHGTDAKVGTSSKSAFRISILS